MAENFITAAVILTELAGFGTVVGIIVYLTVTSSPKLMNRFANLGVSIGTYDYRGYAINYNLYGRKEFSVCHFGHDWEFKTIRGATDFVDSLIDNKEIRKARQKFVTVK